MSQVTITLLFLLFAIVMMFVLNWKLALGVMVIVPVLAVLRSCVRGRDLCWVGIGIPGRNIAIPLRVQRYTSGCFPLSSRKPVRRTERFCPCKALQG